METGERFGRDIKGKTEELWTSFKIMRNNYRDEIRKAKQESWTDFCKDIEKGAEVARLDRLLFRNPECHFRCAKTVQLGVFRVGRGDPSPPDGNTFPAL